MNPFDLLNNVKSLIFDFDGTIADTSKFHEVAFRKAFEPYKVSFDYKKIAGKKTSEAVIDCLKESNLSVNEKIVSSISDRKQSLVRSLIREDNSFGPMPGVNDFLNWARSRYKLSIASSGSRKTIDISLRKLGYSDLFDVIVCSEDVKYAKPSPEIFLKAIYLSNYSKADSLVLEDSCVGMEAAKLAGIAAIDTRIYPFYKIIAQLQKL